MQVSHMHACATLLLPQHACWQQHVPAPAERSHVVEFIGGVSGMGAAVLATVLVLVWVVRSYSFRAYKQQLEDQIYRLFIQGRPRRGLVHSRGTSATDEDMEVITLPQMSKVLPTLVRWNDRACRWLYMRLAPCECRALLVDSFLAHTVHVCCAFDGPMQLHTGMITSCLSPPVSLNVSSGYHGPAAAE